MREILIRVLAHVVLVGGACLGLHWLWQAFLLVIGVHYDEEE